MPLPPKPERHHSLDYGIRHPSPEVQAKIESLELSNAMLRAEIDALGAARRRTVGRRIAYVVLIGGSLLATLWFGKTDVGRNARRDFRDGFRETVFRR